MVVTVILFPSAGGSNGRFSYSFFTEIDEPGVCSCGNKIDTLWCTNPYFGSKNFFPNPDANKEILIAELEKNMIKISDKHIEHVYHLLDNLKKNHNMQQFSVDFCPQCDLFYQRSMKKIYKFCGISYRHEDNTQLCSTCHLP